MTPNHDVDALASAHYADLEPPVNSYIHQLVQIMWNVAVLVRDLYITALAWLYFLCLYCQATVFWRQKNGSS